VTAWRRALRWLALLLLGLPLTALLLVSAVVAWRVPAATALVQQTDTLDTEDVERVLQLARAHDPRRAIPGVVRTLRLSQHEAELLLNHAAARVRPSRWKLAVGADRLQLQASLRLPDNPFGAWLNVELQARQTRGLPQLESVTLGRLPLPVALVEWAIDSRRRPLRPGRVPHPGGGGRAAGAPGPAAHRARLCLGRRTHRHAWWPRCCPSRSTSDCASTPRSWRS
jgi:hypothetical protein